MASRIKTRLILTAVVTRVLNVPIILRVRVITTALVFIAVALFAVSIITTFIFYNVYTNLDFLVSCRNM